WKGQRKEFQAHPEDYVKNILDFIYAFESIDCISVERWLLFRSLTQNDIRLTCDGAGAAALLGKSPMGVVYHAFDQIRRLQSAKAALKNSRLWKVMVDLQRLPKMTKSKLQR